MIVHRPIGVMAECDDCGQENEFEDGVPFWGSDSDARTDLLALGWDVYDDGQAFCSECTAQRICSEIGHSLLMMAECRCQGVIPEHRDGCTPWLNCARCGHFEPAPV